MLFYENTFDKTKKDMTKVSKKIKAVHDPYREKAIRQMQILVRDMRQAEKKFAAVLFDLHDHFKLSGTNLIHYLVLRSNEIRHLQEYLHQQGLSSLTNLESHTLFQVQNVLH